MHTANGFRRIPFVQVATIELLNVPGRQFLQSNMPKDRDNVAVEVLPVNSVRVDAHKLPMPLQPVFEKLLHGLVPLGDQFPLFQIMQRLPQSSLRLLLRLKVKLLILAVLERNLRDPVLLPGSGALSFKHKPFAMAAPFAMLLFLFWVLW